MQLGACVLDLEVSKAILRSSPSVLAEAARGARVA